MISLSRDERFSSLCESLPSGISSVDTPQALGKVWKTFQGSLMRKGDTLVNQSLSTSVGPSSPMCVSRVKHLSITYVFRTQSTRRSCQIIHNLVENMTFVNKKLSVFVPSDLRTLSWKTSLRSSTEAACYRLMFFCSVLHPICFWFFHC